MTRRIKVSEKTTKRELAVLQEKELFARSSGANIKHTLLTIEN